MYINKMHINVTHLTMLWACLSGLMLCEWRFYILLLCFSLVTTGVLLSDGQLMPFIMHNTSYVLLLILLLIYLPVRQLDLIQLSYWLVNFNTISYMYFSLCDTRSCLFYGWKIHVYHQQWVGQRRLRNAHLL